MDGIMDHAFNRTLFYNLSPIHNEHPIAHTGNQRQIVGNKEVGVVILFFQFTQQMDDLCLNGYIQCRGCFIANQ